MQMAGFPFQHHLPYNAPDFAYLFPSDQLFPPPSTAQQEAGGAVSALSCLPSCYYPAFDGSVFPWEVISKVNHVAGTSSISAVTAVSSAPAREGSSSLESDRKLPSADSSKITTSSSSAGQSEPEPMAQRCGQKKRKDAQSCINSESAQSNDVVPEAGTKSCRRPRKRSSGAKAEEIKTAPHQIPTGYIHVRARRGEATDSHSLAERVRRERIREKMKMLQDLVPGCDKVVGKALLLEEIINYVQSLQNQVELLSTKLASMDPAWGYDFGLQFDDYCMPQTEKPEDMSPGLPNVQRTGIVQTTATADATGRSCPLEDSTPPYLLHDHQLGPPCSFPQDNEGNFVTQVEDPRQSFLDLLEFDVSFP